MIPDCIAARTRSKRARISEPDGEVPQFRSGSIRPSAEAGPQTEFPSPTREPGGSVAMAQTKEPPVVARLPVESAVHAQSCLVPHSRIRTKGVQADLGAQGTRLEQGTSPLDVLGPKKEISAIDKRCKEAQRVLAKFPGRVPVICEKATHSNLKEVFTKKFLVPNSMRWGEVVGIIHKHAHEKGVIPLGKTLFLSVEHRQWLSGTEPNTDTMMQELYGRCKAEDGFLYIKYSEHLQVAPAQGSEGMDNHEFQVRVRPEDDLEAHLRSERQLGLQCIDEAVDAAREQVLRLQEEITERVELVRDELEAYPGLGNPRTYEQQCVRNTLRYKIKGVVQDTQNSLEQILGASQEPLDVFNGTRCSALARIDDLLKRLTLLRSEALSLYKEKELKVKREHQENQHTISELAPCVEKLDTFVRCFTNEVAEEVVEGQEMYQSRLDRLVAEEAEYVRANESLEMNPAFAKIREDIKQIGGRLNEQSRRDEERSGLLESWSSILNRMPKVDANRKRRFWQLW